MFWLGQMLTQLSGPAWNTADGAMNAAIGIQAQIIASSEIIHDVDVERNQKRLTEQQKITSEQIR